MTASVSNGQRRSNVAKSAAGAAVDGSDQDLNGTSATTTETPPSTEAPNTSDATARRRRTKRNADDQDGAPSPTGGPVERAVRADLELIRHRDPVLAESALAASAIALAQGMDNPSSTTSLANCGKTLLDVLDRLRELCPPEEKSDGVEDLRSRVRALRVVRQPATTHPVGS